MNKKTNTIIAIIITIIIISLLVIITVPKKEQTQADVINEQLKKQNGSWTARNYSSDIMNIPLVYFDEDEKDYITEEYKNYIFNTENKNKFIPKDYNYTDLIVTNNKSKTKLSGLISLTKNQSANSPELDLEDILDWKNYFTPGKKQICGSCTAIGITAGLEAYVNRKYSLDSRFNSEKIMFSPQYFMAYTNFKGCAGIRPSYYLYFLHLNNTNPNNINHTIKTKLKNQIPELNKFNVGDKNRVSLSTLIQYSIYNNEIPFGIPLEKDVPLLGYDSCEIKELNDRNSNFSLAGMDLRPLHFIPRNYIDANFCPDFRDQNGDTDNHKLYVPEKKDNINKHFIEYTFKVDSNCKNLTQSVKNIKEALTISPLVASLNYYKSIYNYSSGVWEKPEDENIPINSLGQRSGHVVVISGWGVDKISGKEYWILKNNWRDDWGDNSYLKTWIGDSDLNIECKDIFGFGGELIIKPNREINGIYDQIKYEEEHKDVIEELKKERFENILPRPNYQIPDLQRDLNPLFEYYLKNINYLETKEITNTKCISIMNCISNKLNSFYGTEIATQGNKMT